MARIAFLGLGAMGSRMVSRLVEAGHDLIVWNRTAPDKAPSGATTAATPRDAVSKAAVVISMLRSDTASEAVWLDPASGALAGMQNGALGIEASTVTPGHARRLHAAAAKRGIAFLDSPVAGSRPQAEAGQLIFMAGGHADQVVRAEPILRNMGMAVHHAGPAGSGAAVKLMVNSLFGAQVAVIAELIGLAERVGLDPARAVAIIGETPVASPAVKAAASAMLAGSFAPSFPIDLVQKDFGLAQTAAQGADALVPVIDAVEAVFAAAKSEGLGDLNITGVVRRYKSNGGSPV